MDDVYQDSSLGVALRFVQASSYAETYEEVYQAITVVLKDELNFDHALIYDFSPTDKKLFAFHSEKEATQNSFVKLGEGLVGRVAFDLKSEVVLHEQEDETATISSHMCVPIAFHGNLFSVVEAHRHNSAFTPSDLKLTEFISEIAASLLARIRQKSELNHLKEKLEQLLEEKKAALTIAVETVSNQFSELKYQRDKREILLREVHHRVNNNLQIISSLVSLYLNQTEKPDHNTLLAVQSRIQILSSIHLILLKSLELNEISVDGFLTDLCGSLRYNSNANYLSLDFSTTEIQRPLSFNTLIPLGMLIHELIQMAVHKFWNSESIVELSITLTHDATSDTFELQLQGKDCTQKSTVNPPDFVVQQTIIEALCDQLDGDLIEFNADKCVWRLSFTEI